MNLVIVESPSKTKTIKQYLGSDYDVVATKGHIRDIENTGKDNLGLDLENNYKPIYGIIPKQYSTIKMLNEVVKKSDRVYLATDPDREGEAISWHLKETLNLGGKDVKRIEFNEITEPAILEAIKNPRDIDENLFEAQETRKIIDRIIGYKLSSVLKHVLGSSSNANISAGRVQSATLKMITDREEAIKNFTPVVYYQVEVQFRHFKAMLTEAGKQTAWKINDEELANKIVSELDNSFVVSDIKYGTKYEKPGSPFTTSTLIQAALNKYNMSSKKTMKIAQELYEGVEANSKHIAFISYMRTDSIRISDVFKKQLVGHIVNTFGKEYLSSHNFKTNKNAQDAHEAIRPVSLYMTVEKAKEYLNNDQLKIYTLIYNQTVESMMKDTEVETKTVTLTNHNYNFTVTFEKRIFDGFKKNRTEKEKEPYEFKHEIGDVMTSTQEPKLLKKETEGPKRFTEASIVKEMESSGIGRPSTYSSTIEILKSRNYVTIVKKEIVPTQIGKGASKFLIENFGEIVNVDYTANMEKNLDEIALGDIKESDVVPSFYNEFMTLLDEKKSSLKPIETGEVCPNCGSKMVYRSNKNGMFEACSNYPRCKYIKHEQKEDAPKIECPECHTGYLVERVSRVGPKAGKKFWGCSNYPSCKFTISKINQIKTK